MTLMHKFLGASAALALTAGTAAADPAILFDLGGKFDKSFNESAYNGAERWAAETGGSYAEVEIQSDAQREQAIRRFAESGNSIVPPTVYHKRTANEHRQALKESGFDEVFPTLKSFCLDQQQIHGTATAA